MPSCSSPIATHRSNSAERAAERQQVNEGFQQQPTDKTRCVNTVYHFSEDASIEGFEPHIPRSNPTQPPAVWAIDDAHAPLYWFPRECPRVTAWPRVPAEVDGFQAAFCTAALRVHAVELGWIDRIRTTQLFRYSFDAGQFDSWPQASGYWTSTDSVVPVEVEPVGDLLEAHVRAAIELRAVPSLWELHDAVQSVGWDFSIVRMRNAVPRS